jgi:branched-chain amino acid transport system substrate-binding protein
MATRRSFLKGGAAFATAWGSKIDLASASGAPGVTDNEIKIGQTMPYSGPASSFSVIGRAEAAYFRMINEQGGINGRKITLISLDDGYSPPKTVEQTRRLVEQEGVAFIFGSLGGATNLAVRQYLNDNKIPQLGLATAADLVDDIENFPWTVGANPAIATEAHIYTKYILTTNPSARIAILFQNDAFGKAFVKGVQETLGSGQTGTLVKTASYEVSDPTVDPQIISLQASGADMLILGATPKAAAQAIRKTYDMGWSPERFLFNGSSSVITTLKPAGLEKSKGVITAAFGKDPSDPRWKDDPGVQEWAAFAQKYLSANDVQDAAGATGYQGAMLMAQILKQCGDDLSRDNILRQALNVRNWRGPITLPGAAVNTSPTDYLPLHQMQLARFNGTSWELFGDLLSD